ncbi:MAG: hypothetical protein V4539_00890 [Bacteroidota bacterium]
MSEKQDIIDKDTNLQIENEPPHFPEDPHALIPSPETTSMEVHHHPHVEKKNFKEYLLEGLMIFLAVSMGFIAENIREGITERQKEHEYIEAIVEDLSTDQDKIGNAVLYLNERLNYTDSLVYLLNRKEMMVNTSDFYFYGRIVSRYVPFVCHSASFDEMKSSGMFRVIRKKNIVKMILEYYAVLPIIKEYEARVAVIDGDYRIVFAQLADPVVTAGMFNYKKEGLKKPEGNPPLRNRSVELMSLLSMKAQNMLTVRVAIREQIVEMQKAGKELLTLIKKEYHLQNELPKNN